jgi:4-hydroxybenzoate polyprenyltransferase
MLFFYAHYFIALAAVASFLQTWNVLKIAPTSPVLELCGFVFFATLGVYNLHAIIGLQYLKKVNFDDSARLSALQKRPRLAWANLCIALLFGGYCTFFLVDYALLLPPFLLALAYVAPIWRGHRLRDFGQPKLFVLAFVWAWATVILPFGWSVLTLAAAGERALFIFALTLPFDVRDMALDAKEEVQTLAARLGRDKSIVISAVLLVAWGVASGVFYGRPLFFLAGGVSAAAVGGLLIWKKAADWYFSVLLDGLIIGIFLLLYFGVGTRI